MQNEIEAIFFDIGGTLRRSRKRSEEEKKEFLSQIAAILNLQMTPEALYSILLERGKAYGKWGRQTYIELNEEELWTKWMAPDCQEELVRKNAVQLNQLWRSTTGCRTPFPETKGTILELFRRGYRMGIISNTTSSVEVPALLKELGIAGCIESILLSCEFGSRKPDPAMHLEAAKRMNVDPCNCAYIGDRRDRDVTSSRLAGFSKVVIMQIPDIEPYDTDDDCNIEPDLVLTNLSELLPLFPKRSDEKNGKVRYDASFSSMWAIKNFQTFSDFLIASHNLGFNKIELNHQVDSEMLSGIDLPNARISSVHEPCPADISAAALKERDWLISSTNEEFRLKGVQSIKNSIDLAARLKLPVIVVHCGQVVMDTSIEIKLRALYTAGEKESQEYQALKHLFIERRNERIAPHLIALKKSLHELLEYAAKYSIRLGLENRYHYFDIPGLDEMEELLALAGPDSLGFIYDVGHAQTLDQLGFYPHEDWLKRFSSRMIETHIHDVQGIIDHMAPGLGDVDFERIAPYLPEGIIRTLELAGSNTPEQIHTGLEYLAEKGCVSKILS
jgi:HAD superfamily hydrolase (TIGR01549 family)